MTLYLLQFKQWLNIYVYISVPLTTVSLYLHTFFGIHVFINWSKLFSFLNPSWIVSVFLLRWIWLSWSTNGLTSVVTPLMRHSFNQWCNHWLERTPRFELVLILMLWYIHSFFCDAEIQQLVEAPLAAETWSCFLIKLVQVDSFKSIYNMAPFLSEPLEVIWSHQHILCIMTKHLTSSVKR